MAALLDWEQRFKTGQSLLPNIQVNRKQAEKALRIFKRLRVPDMIGKPRLGEVCGQWFLDFVYTFCGAVDEHGKRTINEAFICVSKKNSKTSYVSALMLTMMILNRRPSAEFVIVSPTKEIAKISFNQTAGAIRADPELSKVFHIRDHIKQIDRLQDDSSLLIKSADTDVITGGKQVGTFIDETHELPRKSNAREVMVQLRGTLAAKPDDGFIIQATTQAMRDPVGVFSAELNRARRVRDGEIDLPYLPLIFEWPKDWVEQEKWREEKYWGLVNPNLHKSVDLQFLRNEFKEAQANGLAAEQLFVSQHLNVEVGVRLAGDGWVGANYWEESTDETLTLESLLDRSEVVTVGIDGGGLEDLFGLAVLGREIETHQWLLWTHAWGRQILIDRNPVIEDTLKAFITNGEMSLTEKHGDLEEIIKIINRIRERNLLPAKGAIGIDPCGVSSLVDALVGAKYEEPQYCAVIQGYKLNYAIIGAERKLANGSMLHHDSALLKWCVGNARRELRGNAVVILKSFCRQHEKIDPLVAAFDAVALMSVHPKAGNHYEDKPRVLSVG